jgi:hypothetical protein
MVRKTGHVIARGPHTWQVRVCMPAVARLPRTPPLRPP